LTSLLNIQCNFTFRRPRVYPPACYHQLYSTEDPSRFTACYSLQNTGNCC